MKKLLVNLPWILLGVLVFFLGKSCTVGEATTITITDTVRVEPEDYASVKEDLAITDGVISGLRDRIRGLEERPPSTVFIVDTVEVVDTVFVSVDSRGVLTYQFLTNLDIGTAELRTGINVRDCDDGFEIRDRQVFCDRPRFGHLAITLDAGIYDALAGFDWKPSYRSPWLISAGYVFPYDRKEGDYFTARVKRSFEVW